MMCLSASTASRTAAFAAVLLLAGGCGHRGTSPGQTPVVRGWANLDVLVRYHPGWAGVAQYDLALVRLEKASVRLSLPAGDASLGSLPANALPLPPLPAGNRQDQQRRLEAVKRVQVARLRARRAQARAAELFPLQEAWQRDAEVAYVQAVQTVQANYLRQGRREAAGRNAARVNLTLQIRALQDTINGWETSPSPAPRLQKTRALLAQKQAQLAVIDAAQRQAAQTNARERDAALAEARASRSTYVQTRTDQKLAALRAQDDVQITAFSARLARQEQALLRGPTETTLPDAGPLNAETLPRTAPGAATLPGSVARSQAQLASAEARLRRQRTRWLAFLYDDTRAAALDIAPSQHWKLTFGKTGIGAELTATLARLLTARVWKS